jgi:Protein of unknown function (DUF3303)
MPLDADRPRTSGSDAAYAPCGAMCVRADMPRRSPMSQRLYMVVEHFRNGNAVDVYRRFRDKGRMVPEGLVYVSSWVDEKLERCYQLMETDSRGLLDAWMANWCDIVDFEVHPVITSKEASDRIAPRLEVDG